MVRKELTYYVILVKASRAGPVSPQMSIEEGSGGSFATLAGTVGHENFPPIPMPNAFTWKRVRSRRNKLKRKRE